MAVGESGLGVFRPPPVVARHSTVLDFKSTEFPNRAGVGVRDRIRSVDGNPKTDLGEGDFVEESNLFLTVVPFDKAVELAGKVVTFSVAHL